MCGLGNLCSFESPGDDGHSTGSSLTSLMFYLSLLSLQVVVVSPNVPLVITWTHLAEYSYNGVTASRIVDDLDYSPFDLELVDYGPEKPVHLSTGGKKTTNDDRLRPLFWILLI